jgi:hypothetical protein
MPIPSTYVEGSFVLSRSGIDRCVVVFPTTGDGTPSGPEPVSPFENQTATTLMESITVNTRFRMPAA